MKFITINHTIVSLENVLAVDAHSSCGKWWSINISYRDNNRYQTGYKLDEKEKDEAMKKIIEIFSKNA